MAGKKRAKNHPEVSEPETKGETGDQAALQAAIAAFDIEGPDLDPAIKAAAFASGSYPHDQSLDNDAYEAELAALQVELLKMQDWVGRTGERLLIVFEGRDAAGKDGAILRFTQHLRPRGTRVVALPKPSDTEAGQWYFQRYIKEMPTRGEIVMFDRSWYNRAGVERVMGFCTEAEVDRFMEEAPALECFWVRDGVRLVKLFLSIGHAMQLKRLHQRYQDPLNRWKLSPIDYKAVSKWDAYSAAFDAFLERTDTLEAPWTVIKANDKRRARLAAIRRVLGALPYDDKDEALVGRQDDRIVLPAHAYLAAGGER